MALRVAEYTKHFIPLESDPEIFSSLSHSLGVSRKLRFEEVITLDEPALLPRPALALIVVFPAAETYDDERENEDDGAAMKSLDAARANGIVWVPQVIGNACGLFALMHAICNSAAREHIGALVAHPEGRADIRQNQIRYWPS